MTGKSAAEREISTAKVAINGLLEQRRELEQMAPTRAAEMSEISYAALVEGDKSAKARLQDLHRQAASAGSEIAAVDAALAEARRRLADGEQNLARELERENAQQVLRLFDQMKAAALRVDEHARGLAAAYAEFEAAHRQIIRRNCEVITHATLWALSMRAVRWQLHGLPPPVGEYQPPRDRLELPAMMEAWERMYGAWAARRLGDGPLPDPDGEAEELEPFEMEAAE